MRIPYPHIYNPKSPNASHPNQTPKSKVLCKLLVLVLLWCRRGIWSIAFLCKALFKPRLGILQHLGLQYSQLIQ